MTSIEQEIPNWAKGIPANIGIPKAPHPVRCSACATPIWRWNGFDWVCYNCKIYAIVYERKDGDLSTLDGCVASGLGPKPALHIDNTLPNHPCYHCNQTAWVWDRTMRNYRCNVCYPDDAPCRTQKSQSVTPASTRTGNETTHL